MDKSREKTVRVGALRDDCAADLEGSAFGGEARLGRRSDYVSFTALLAEVLADQADSVERSASEQQLGEADIQGVQAA